MIAINKSNTQFITDAASQLIQKYNSNNPFELCSALGIIVHFKDLGEVKGMYTYYKRNRFIVINDDLEPMMQRIVCAHELGHDLFHRTMAEKSHMYDTHLNNFSLKPEFESNVFAAELLIDDKEIVSNISLYSSASELAGQLEVSEPLVRLKCAIMKNRGTDIAFGGDFDFDIFA